MSYFRRIFGQSAKASLSGNGVASSTAEVTPTNGEPPENDPDDTCCVYRLVDEGQEAEERIYCGPEREDAVTQWLLEATKASASGITTLFTVECGPPDP